MEVLDDALESHQITMSTYVIDAMVVVQSINVKEKNIATCKDFVKEFIQRCKVLATGSQTLRLVFDTYHEKSLKESTRNLRRGEEAQLRYKVEDSTIIKGTMKQFLAHNETKCDFVTYLAKEANKAFQDISSTTPFHYLVSSDGITTGNIESHHLNN